MIRGGMMARYALSSDDRRAFDRWVKIYIVAGSAMVAALLAVTLANSDSFGPNSAIAGNDKAAVTETPVPGRPMSPFDLMIRITPESLPVEQVDQPF